MSNALTSLSNENWYGWWRKTSFTFCSFWSSPELFFSDPWTQSESLEDKILCTTTETQMAVSFCFEPSLVAQSQVSMPTESEEFVTAQQSVLVEPACCLEVWLLHVVWYCKVTGIWITTRWNSNYVRHLLPEHSLSATSGVFIFRVSASSHAGNCFMADVCYI